MLLSCRCGSTAGCTQCMPERYTVVTLTSQPTMRDEFPDAYMLIDHRREIASLRERIGVLKEALLRIRACATDQLAMHTREGGLDVTSRTLALLADLALESLAAIMADAGRALADDACLAKETET